MARVPYATTLEESLVKKLRITAAEEERKANDILEELLQKYFKEKKGGENG